MNETTIAGQVREIYKIDLGIDSDYRHGPKQLTPGEPLEKSGTVLKWYALYPIDRVIPEEITELAREHVRTTEIQTPGLGFTLLHRCGGDFYFLIVSTWRNNNELWETVFYKDGDAMPRFELFPRDGTQKPAFCVWELVCVWQEKEAWERFLRSTRDAAAKEAWLVDRYSGQA